MHSVSQGSSPIDYRLALIVEEALGAVLAPARRLEIVDEALSTAGLDAIPDQPSSLRVFVEGALFSVLARHLEVSDALELVAQIRAALELALNSTDEDRAVSDVRERITLPAPPNRTLVVTGASLVVFLLGDVIGEHVEVLAVSNEDDLRDWLRRSAGSSMMVVVDRKHPCVEPSVCELLRAELSEQSTVVWWGAEPEEHVTVNGILAGGPRTITCDADLRLADLGELCRRLLEGGS